MSTRHAYHGADIALEQAEDWRAQARCRDEDPELWFPHESQSADEAIRICGRCDVRQQCLDWAIDNRIEHGVWGGETAAARKRLAKAAGKHTTHVCLECGAGFTSVPNTRPKYCPDCRPIVHRRSKQMRQAQRNERRRK